MRIVAGKYAGQSFTAPKTVARPTTDRVKESIFQTLEVRHGLEGRTVLDVFAGSGALTFEALSRGAKFALMNDRSNDAAQVLRANSLKLKLPLESYQIVKNDALKDVFYSRVSRRVDETGRFNLVFLDPPYDFDDDQINDILNKLHSFNLLDDEAIVYLESSKTRKLSAENADAFTEDLIKTYGNTVIQILSNRCAR